jgi:hypothetical protein
VAEPADDRFLTRWSRRKARVRDGQTVPSAPAAEAPSDPSRPSRAATHAVAAAPAADTAMAAPALRPPTLDDVALLTPASDFSRFVAPGVEARVRNAALKQLFSDPHFNVMDGLDTYIDDYGKPDPLPAGMLHQMVQSKMLGLFDDEPEEAPPNPDANAAPATLISDPTSRPGATPAAPLPPSPPAGKATDEDPDLQLQPDHAAGCSRPNPGAEPDPGRQH